MSTQETEAFTVRTDKSIAAKLDELARQTERSRNYVVNQAIRSYLELQRWQLEEAEQGIGEADRGEVVPHEEVMAELDKVITARKK